MLKFVCHRVIPAVSEDIKSNIKRNREWTFLIVKLLLKPISRANLKNGKMLLNTVIKL